MTQQRQQWESRAASAGSSLAGVLFKGLPPSANRAIHDWHVQLIRQQLVPRLPSSAIVVDFGCGYGRLSPALLALKPDVRLIGLDFAQTYCREYQRAPQARAICSNLGALPLKAKSVDAVLCCVALMYAPPERRQQWLDELARILKPGGCLLLIEPGQRFVALNRLAGRSTGNGGGAFLVAELHQLLQGRFSIKTGGGAPALTLALPLLFTLGRKFKDGSALFRVLRSIDTAFGSWGLLSFQHWCLALRKPDFIG